MMRNKESADRDPFFAAGDSHLTDAQDFSRHPNDILTFLLQLQARGVEELEAEFTAEYGPIPPEIAAWADTITWPK